MRASSVTRRLRACTAFWDWEWWQLPWLLRGYVGAVPLTAVVLIGGAIAAVWGLVQISERIADWPVNREKNRLELEKLRRELNPGDQAEQLPEILKERGALEYYERSIQRVAENEIKITDIRFRVEPSFPSRRQHAVLPLWNNEDEDDDDEEKDE